MNLIPDTPVTYLRNPIQAFGIPTLLICVAIYQAVVDVQPYPLAYIIAILLALAATFVFLRAPRGVVYAILAIALIVYLAVFIFVVSNGEHDRHSTRDEAVELAAQAMLEGSNPWRVELGVPVTTGPSSILLALPFVAVFKQINALSLLFWLAFFAALLVADLLAKNNSWPVLVTLFITGVFGVRHTLYWSLDELYFPVLFMTVAFWVIRKDRWLWGGSLLAASVLARPSYGFLVIAFGLWLLFEGRFTTRKIGMVLLGGALAFVVILLPFVILFGGDLISHNPWRPALAFTAMNWPATNPIFQLLNRSAEKIGASGMRWVKLGMVLLPLVAISWGLRRARVAHPFWHLTIAALLSHFLVWLPAHLPDDYILMILLPAMLGVAHQVEPEEMKGGKG
jgi:hypothetical protein